MTPKGTSFYVMECLEALLFHRYCEEYAPLLDERLRLFEPIAQAAVHALRYLVIHDEIKPANILVTQDRKPKLLGIGVTKLLDAEAERTRTATQLAQRRITPG